MENNPFLPEIFKYLKICIAAYSSSYLVGRISLGFVTELRNTRNHLEITFYCLVIGIILLISLFATIWTKGNSVFLISFIIIGLFYITHEKKNTRIFELNKISKKEVIYFLSILGCFVVSFFLSYYIFYMRSGGEIWSDYVYYSNISNVISLTHVETSSVFTEHTPTDMYHFSEIWFTSLWSTVFDCNHSYALHLITFPFLFMLTILGAILIAKSIIRNNLASILLGLSIVFLKPILTYIIPNLDNYFSYSATAFFPKYFVISVLLLFAALQFINDKYTLTFFILLLLVPFYSTMSPGILSGLFFTVVIILFSKFGFKLEIIFNKYSLTILLVLFSFILFYFLQYIHSEHDNSLIFSSVKNNPLLWTFKFIIKRVGFAYLVILPLVILIIIKYHKIHSTIFSKCFILTIFAIIGVFTSSVISAVVSNFMYDGYQISKNFTDTVFNVVIFICISSYISLLKPFKSIVIVLILFFFNLFMFVDKGLPFTYPKSKRNDYAKEFRFYNEIKNELNEENQYNFGFYRAYASLFPNSNTYIQINLFLPLSKMVHVIPTGYYAPYCLSVFDIPETSNSNYDDKKNSHFWKFVNIQQSLYPNITHNECAVKFIKVKQIKYILIEDSYITPNYILDNSCLLNELDGTRVYKINKDFFN